MKLVYQYMVIFFNFSPTSNHIHPLKVENCDSNSRLVVDEDDNGKFRLERVEPLGDCLMLTGVEYDTLSLTWGESAIAEYILQFCCFRNVCTADAAVIQRRFIRATS